MITKSRSLFGADRAIIKEIAGSLSNQFTLCKQPLIIESEHIAIDMHDDLYKAAYTAADVAKVYTEFEPITPAYSCFNLASATAYMRIIDLLDMNECGRASIKSPSVEDMMKNFAENCKCAIISNSVRFGLIEKDYMCGFTASNADWLEHPIMGIRSVKLFVKRLVLLSLF